MRARLRRLPAVLVLLLVGIPGLLLAHGALKRSDPAENATLVVAPVAIRLTFTEPAELAIGRIELTGPGGEAVSLSPVRHGDSATVMVADILGPLHAGRYIVSWQVAGRDGHPVRGTYGFLIANDATGLAPPDTTRASVPGAGTTTATAADSAVDHASHEMPGIGAFDAQSPLYAAIRWLGFAGLLTLVGAASFGRLVIPGALRRQASVEWGAEARRHLRTVALAAVATLFIVLLLRLAAQSVAIHGRIAVDSSLLAGTLWGKAWLLQLIGLAGAALAFLGKKDTGATAWLLVLATLVIAASFALSGHASAVPESMAFAVPIDIMHILGAGGWIGTLLLVVIVGLPAAMRSSVPDRGRTVAILINTFSPLALIFAGTAALTGVVSAWTQLGTMSALWTTRYGQVLVVKLALVLLVIGAGAYNAYRVRPTLGDASSGARIRRTATAELVIAALVLAVTAVLVATPTEAGLR